MDRPRRGHARPASPPAEEVSYTYTDYREVAKAIREMVIRGAPAIGVAAAMGAALGVLHSSAQSVMRSCWNSRKSATLSQEHAPPPWISSGPERMKRRFAELTSQTSDLAKIRQGMVEEAQQIHLEKKATDEAIGRFGAEFMPSDGRVMTQCNAGALATGGIGSALGVISRCLRTRKETHVLVPKRVLIFRARASLPGNSTKAASRHAHHDNMVGHFLKTGKVSAIVTVADRIAGQRDTANKIGTYQIAVLAKENNVPFYIAAPSPRSISIPDGDNIPIDGGDADEERRKGARDSGRERGRRRVR